MDRRLAFAMGEQFGKGVPVADLLTVVPLIKLAEAPEIKPESGILPLLNKLLRAELTAIHQYLVHYQAAENAGYKKLAAAIKKLYDDEREHADKLTYRIIFLGGKPEVGELNPIQYGDTPQTWLENDAKAEQQAVDDYNAAVGKAAEAGDNTSGALFGEILKDEEEHHLDELTTHLDQIKAMGIGPWLVTQV